MFGGDGNDIYIVDNAGDRGNEVSDTGGTDLVRSSVAFTLGNRVENLLLTGSASVTARGNALDNTITGNPGHNLIWGGLGADHLTGGGGNDSFQYTAAAESNAASTDTISGFGSGDRIDLSAIDANANAADGNQAFTFVGANAFSNTAGELRAVNNGSGSWTIQADTDGDGNADLVINVTTESAFLIGAGEFLV
jgi:serralysin